MRPETDPAICQELEAAVRDIARQSTIVSPGMTAQVRRYDSGYVPQRVMARLSGLAKHYGYTMRRSDYLDEISAAGDSDCMGATSGPADPHNPSTVRLARRMTAASEARVAAHEVAHVVLGHAGLTYEAACVAIVERLIRGGEDPHQEAAAELAAGAFCKLAGIGTGRFSPRFVAVKTGGTPIPEHVIQAAVLAARLLWAGTKPALEQKAAA